MSHAKDNLAEAILKTSEQLIQASQQFLEKAPLNTSQREDIEAVLQAAKSLKAIMLERQALLSDGLGTSADLQRLRHDLRNELNIIMGYTRMLIRDLPDNLLLHMEALRALYAYGKDLQEQTDHIR